MSLLTEIPGVPAASDRLPERHDRRTAHNRGEDSCSAFTDPNNNNSLNCCMGNVRCIHVSRQIGSQRGELLSRAAELVALNAGARAFRFITMTLLPDDSVWYIHKRRDGRCPPSQMKEHES